MGTRIGAFEVKAKLGEGGMGAVYIAEHAVLDTRRVIKLLLPELTRNATVVQRFINEARAAASIHHRNIIAVHDVGQLPDSGDWYIVMDHVDGATLRALLDAHGGPLPPELALPLLAQIANGLEAAHACGIIHRDLKPDNVVVTPQRHVVILDFGVAKLNDQLAGSLTVTGQAIGTPAYMPPEQLRGATVDATCDVFALGVIAYQLITGGYLPYQDEHAPEPYYSSLPAAELYHRQITRAAVDPRQRGASVTDGWATAILAALDRDPGQRPQTAGAFALALAAATPDGASLVRSHAPELLERAEPVRTRTSIATVQARPPSTHGAAVGQSLSHTRRARPFWPVLVATALVTSAVTLVVMLRVGGAEQRAAVPAPPDPVAMPVPVPVPADIPEPSVDAATPIVPVVPVVVEAPAPEPVVVAPPPPPLRPRVVGSGTITVTVTPWAVVTIDRKPYGQTPLTATVPAGRHRVRIANDATGRSETIDVTVEAGHAATVERSFR